MNESEIQQLMAQMKAESPDLPNQEIYNFLHANNFGSDADRYKHLFGDIKTRTEDRSVAASNNTFGTLAKDFIQTVKDNPEYSIPAAFLGGYAANKALPQVGEAISSGVSSLKNRFLSNSNKGNIVSSVADAPTVPNTIAQAQIDADLNTYIANSEKAKADKIRYAQEQEAIRAARFNNQSVISPTSEVQARNQAAEFRARQLNPIQPPPPPPPSISNTVATGGNVGQAVKQTVANELDATPPPQELRTGTGKLAYAGQGPAAEIRAKGKKAGEPMLRNNYARVEDVPAGYAFVPGAQHIDTSRTNIGQTEYTKAYTERPFPLTNELAVQESNEINRLLGRPTRAEAKAAGIALPPQTPGITKHVLEGKDSPFMGTKAAKVGGVLGALVAIPDLVNAQTAGQRGMAGANMLEAVLPPGFTMSNVGEGSSNIPNVNAAALLGSPYAQTDWAKTQRLREKAGAGRGIAPPSSYR